MKQLWIVLPLLVSLSACGTAPDTDNAPATTAAIPEAESAPKVQVQRAALKTTRHSSVVPAHNNSDITSVVFSRMSNNNESVEKWLRKELRIDNNQVVTLTDYNRGGKAVNKKTGRLSDSEFASLLSLIRASRYQNLNSLKRNKPLPGNVTDLVTISTSEDFHQFKQDSNQQFPAPIQAIFTRYTKAR